MTEKEGSLDIRWRQRFANYKKAFAQLHRFIEKGELNEFEKQGLIQAFEYTFELGWNCLKDYLLYQGVQDIIGARDAIREAFSLGLIQDGQGWMNMLTDRNQTSHTYNEETAEAITTGIQEHHVALLKKLLERLEALETDK